MSAAYDPWTARIERVRAHIEQQRRPGNSGEAILAVLNLQPPDIAEGETYDDHDIATDGWWTCHSTVLKTLAVALGIEQG